MSHLATALPLIGQLLSYPGPETLQWVERLAAELRDDLSDAASHITEFLEFAQRNDTQELEEVFTHTFDINPACALEVGWHLFGEEYIRGLFMVRMREELRKYGLQETVELPDHIAHVLSVVAVMPSDEATRFVCACVLPAVKKMNLALSDKDTPYRHILSCLESVLATQWGEAYAATAERSPATDAPRANTEDPLHAFPIADVVTDCETCAHVASDAVPQNLVPRETEFSRLGGHDDRHPPRAVGVAGRCRVTDASISATIGDSIQTTEGEQPATPTPARKQ